jgi:CRISPR-associated endonuclease/helicase Cas3
LQTANPDAGELDRASNDAPKRSARKVDHSTFGARYVAQKFSKHTGQLLAYCIAGHHGGLPDGNCAEENGQRRALIRRLETKYPIPAVEAPEFRVVRPTIRLRWNVNLVGFQLAFFVRMIFSCLVDADRLETEGFCNPEQAKERAVARPTVLELRSQLDHYMSAKQSNVPPTPVNRLRATVLVQCVERAELQPGFFSLQVPTGGGKTYSSLAFALHHACLHDMRRIVYAIPFTSIIDQTTDAFRTAFGPHAERGVLEHHTDLKPEHDTRANQLATENWDAPVIVTTNVQFFESLFASSTNSSRKLHRLAGSVIVLDEAQMIPVELLTPSLAALNELVLNYGCSVVLCTATQPALAWRPEFPIGITNIREIVADSPGLFEAVQSRVEVNAIGMLPDEALAERLAAERQALCIVNTRRHAARLFDRVSKLCSQEDCFHLSTYMCGKHRRIVLRLVRRRLEQGKSCRVISTQLVEAGVDLDFPVVYRASAGFDSIAQAAGRCNREGTLTTGQTYVFEAEELPPPGLLRDAAQTRQELLQKHPNPIAPGAIKAYFELFFWSQKHRWDQQQIIRCFGVGPADPFLAFQFREAALKYRIIRDDQIPILVPYDKRARAMWNALNQRRVEYIPQRQLQPYLVSVHQECMRRLEASGAVMTHESGVWLLLNTGAYSATKGLMPDEAGSNFDYLGV